MTTICSGILSASSIFIHFSDFDERLKACDGLKKKAKNKCIKKLAKKMKESKKNKKKSKKKKKSQSRGEFEAMEFGSRKEKRQYRREMRQAWRNWGNVPGLR